MRLTKVEDDILVPTPAPSVLLLLKAAAERGVASVIRDTEKGSDQCSPATESLVKGFVLRKYVSVNSLIYRGIHNECTKFFWDF